MSTVPFGNTIVVMVGAGQGAIVMLKGCGELDAPQLLVARTVKLKVPNEVGAPEITPVLEARDNPGGKLPEIIAKLIGAIPPLVSIVAL
jgi:hypothetical protein